MEKDYVEFDKKNDISVNLWGSHLCPSLHNITGPWPFSMWGINVIDIINPKVANGHKFILIAIDYFIKWVEAISYGSEIH